MSLDLGTLVQYVELDPQAFNRRYAQVAADIDRLRQMDAGVNVTANTTQAQTQLAGVEASVQSLPATSEVQVTADTAQAETAVEAFADGLVSQVAQGTGQARDEFGRFVSSASSAGGEAGESAGKKMGAGIIGALTALPIAGTLVALGAVAGKALLDGLENEVREDTISARTGLDAATAARIATAAGEAYGANFGESIAANMETARVALGSGLLDPAATSRDTQAVIEKLQGVADVMQGDVVGAAQAVSRMLSTGVAKSADEAFDILIRGYQTTGDLSEDLLDTFTEYSSGFAAMGLTGAQAMGLMNQAIEGGVLNTDYAADSIREWGRIAREEPERAAEYWKSLGLDVDAMNDAVSRGGPAAADAFGKTLAAIQMVEDPQRRALLYTQALGDAAGDFGLAWDNLDLSKAITDLGTLEGAASGAISTIGDNAAGQLESAKRNIEVATDGIKGALAAAFGPQIEDFSTFVQENRTAVVQFLLDLANGALDFGRSMVEAGAAGIETFGEVSGAIGDVSLQLFDMFNALNQFGPFKGELDGAVDGLGRAALAARDIESAAGLAADGLRTNLIDNAIDPAQARLNEFGLPLTAQAGFHDATVALAADVNGIGYAADGSKLAVDRMGASFDSSTSSGKALDDQLRTAVESLHAQTEAGIEAGRTQDELAADYAANRGALLDQVEAMGFTRAEAEKLIDTYGAIPTQKKTTVIADVLNARAAIAAFRDDISNIPLTRTFTARYAEVQAAGGNTPGRASGGPVWPGQPFWVGEQGPELVTFGASGFVHNAQDSAAMATSSPSLSGLTIEGTLNLGDGLVGMVRGVVREESRGQGRSIASGRV